MKNFELVYKLIEKGYRICPAESCTGGMLASAIVEVPDASKVFDMGFVTYANDAKIKLLSVDEALISEHGVVSEPVALSMARGAARASGAQVGVGISGIAGPTGGSAKKPVGTVCFGFYINGSEFSKTCRFGDIGRTCVREKACEFVIDTLLENL
ncbi:MAG: CinA family protein [Clostridia bacterium]|nr:CinA family protein [Clostridia bacterium]